MRLFSTLALMTIGLSAIAPAQTLDVEVGQTRSLDALSARTDQAVRTLNGNIAQLTRQQRTVLARTGHFHPEQPISFPATVWLTSNGRRLPAPTRSQTRGPGAINLVFDAGGPNAFDPTYQAFLQQVFNQAQPFLDALFGVPSTAGNVAVKNYDATMGDRDIVSGGYYVPNTPNTPEIRFPFYGNDRKEVTAVNFIHTLLLAYIGPNQYGFDAFNEGLVRAVTMRIGRTSSLMVNQLGLDTGQIEQVLTNTYDVEGHYDWYNQRALGGSQFIAPNLRSVPLPDAGSVGGLYLLRYKMAGAAWVKTLSEIPGFISAFNSGFYAQPAIANNVSALVALGQTTLNNIRPSDPTIEGMSFAEWFKRQFILETRDTQGLKLLVEPVPITSGLSGSDYGVFVIQANWFETLAGGNETLLSGTSYPIIWEGNFTFNRIFPSTPDAERMDIAGGYGVVVPNIRDENGGQPYRAVVDVPIQDQIERVYLPVGAIATASQQTPRDFYGTVVGANLQAGDTLRLRVTVNGNPISDIPVSTNAFGVLLNTPEFLGNARLGIEVVRNRAGNDQVLLTRRVNKGPGPLAVDLRVESEASFAPSGGLPKGISLLGFPNDPFLSYNPDVIGVSPTQLLAGRYNSAKAKYDLFPELEPFKVGHAYFVRLNAAQPGFSVSGRAYRNVEASVALKPGWNLISAPLMEVIATSRVRVVKVSDSPMEWTEALGVDIGTEFFEFMPGIVDPATGAPETGSFVPATHFEVGKGYFVRVLAPEGVTLTFRQSDLAGSAPSRSRVAATVPTGWRIGIGMIDAKRRKVSAIIGQSVTATRSFDPKEDSGMPPGIGGRQVIVEDYEAMYRDIRPLVGGEVFTIRLQGLTPKKLNRIEFSALLGKAPKLTIRDSKGKNLGTIKAGSVYNHFARSQNEYIQIVVGGSK